MLSFESDYILGAHEKVLEALIKTNNEMLPGYGNDVHTKNAENLIKKACNSPDSEVFFISGGTQANKTVIATMLKPYEGVIAPVTGHISLHEVGAIEYTGHKVIELEGEKGKLSADTARAEVANNKRAQRSAAEILTNFFIFLLHYQTADLSSGKFRV
mgnify:CR=1 FL=1